MKKVIFIFIFIFIKIAWAEDNKKIVNLIGGGMSGVEAEVCFEDSIKFNVSSNYSTATNNLKAFVTGLKNNLPVERYVKNSENKIQLPVPKRFYTDQTNIKFKHVIYWDSYIGLGVQYYYPNNQNLHWREDFYCQGVSCLLDFEFASDENNQLFESIYYLIINEKKSVKASPLKVSNKISKIRIYSQLKNKNDATLCPLYLNYSLIEVGERFCLNCGDKKNEGTGDTKEIVNSVLQQIEKFKSNDPKELIDENIKYTKIVGINNEEAGIGIDDYINYLSTWKNIEFLGYINDGDKYFVFVEYNYSDGKRGKLEIIRLKKTKKLEYKINLKIDDGSYGENILYSKIFLNAIRNKYMPDM